MKPILATFFFLSFTTFVLANDADPEISTCALKNEAGKGVTVHLRFYDVERVTLTYDDGSDEAKEWEYDTVEAPSPDHQASVRAYSALNIADDVITLTTYADWLFGDERPGWLKEGQKLASFTISGLDDKHQPAFQLFTGYCEVKE